jgi:hypothetical protein
MLPFAGMIRPIIRFFPRILLISGIRIGFFVSECCVKILLDEPAQAVYREIAEREGQ